MKKFLIIFIILMMILSCEKTQSTSANTQEIKAHYTKDAIELDGKLDENCWASAEIYQLSFSQDKLQNDVKPENKGEVKFLWDDSNFYVGVKYFDEDVVALGNENEMPHYLKGDVCEIFIKPQSQPWYWELYATPHSKQTTMFFPGGGRLGLPEDDTKSIDIEVAGFVHGSLNDYSDKDEYWTAEIKLPIEDIANGMDSSKFMQEMTILIGRYNYSVYLNCVGAELTMYPPLSRTFYHLTSEYAKVVFEK